MSITRIIMSDESSRRWKASLMAGSLGFMFGAAVSFFVLCRRRQRGPINDRICCNERTRRPSHNEPSGVPLVQDVIVPPPFLWEPQAATPRRQKAAFRHYTSSEKRFSGPHAGIPITAISDNVFTVISKDNNNERQQQREHQQHQQQQLEFLSTMTFANGGIRAPSCPCCQ